MDSSAKKVANLTSLEPSHVSSRPYGSTDFAFPVLLKRVSKKVPKRSFLEPEWARETCKGLTFIQKGPSSRGIASSRARDAAEGCIRHHKTTKDTPKVAQEPPGATPISRPFCRPGAPNHPKTTPRPPQDTPEARLKSKWLRGTSRS